MKTSNQEMNPLHGLSPDDAVDMLIADHKQVARLFAEFQRLTDEGGDDDKASVVEQICAALTVHAQLEEELFYPAVRDATGDDDQVDEAVVEHAGAKILIAQLQGASPDEDLYDAKVTVLGEQINHHVEEEEGSLFPKARHAGLDMQALGAQMLARKAALQGAGDADPSDQTGNEGTASSLTLHEGPHRRRRPATKKNATSNSSHAKSRIRKR